MQHPIWRDLAPGVARWMEGAVLAAAALYLLAFVVCVSMRLPFGFETTWMESGLLAMTERLKTGQSIYVEPSTSYIPLIYPPLHFVVAASVTAAFSSLDGFVGMRLVSLASTVATAVLLGAQMWRSGLVLRRVVIFTGLFFAFYGRFQYWHDSSRVDSLFVLLIFAALVCLVEGQRWQSALAAGVLAGLAAVTKQPAIPLFLGAALVLGLGWRQWRRAALAAITLAVTAVAVLALLGELTNRWLYYYLWTVPASHPLLASNLGRGLRFMLLTMPLFLLWVYLVLRAPRAAGTGETVPARPADSARRWAWLFVVATVVMLAMRAKVGASVNFFLPLIPLGIMAMVTAEGRLRLREPLLLVQFAILAYNPVTAVPRADDWKAGFELLTLLRNVPGDVLLPQFPGYLTMTGKAQVAHGVAMCDLVPLRPDLIRGMEAELREGRYAAVVPWSDLQHPRACQPVLSTLPRLQEPIPTGGDFFNRQHRSRMDSLHLGTGLP
jgi:hypothetical protein